MWNTFARFGLGEEAASNGGADTAPTPGFSSPHQQEGQLTFAPTPVGPGSEDAPPIVGELYVGQYEARSRPVADSDPATPLGESVSLVPGTYDMVARADGYGLQRLRVTVRAGQVRDLTVQMRRNLASSSNGAVATGDGVNLDRLVDDTEASNWAAHGALVSGREVTVELDPSRSSHQVGRVQVSALLRPPITDDADPGTQNRYTALRRFEILVCDASTGADCSQEASYRSVFRSGRNAFPAIAPRPRAPDLAMRSFELPRSQATHVMLRVLDNQCTGGPDFRGDQDDDARHDTDCVTGSAAATGTPQGTVVRAAELQVFDQ
jgi:hypothetical protein